MTQVVTIMTQVVTIMTQVVTSVAHSAAISDPLYDTLKQELYSNHSHYKKMKRRIIS